MIGFLDCYSGISGDMLLGALVDAGLPLEELRAGLARLALGEAFSIDASEVSRAGVRATAVHVIPAERQPHRPFRDVAALIEDAGLPASVRATSLAILRRVAQVEARVHGGTPDEVELHEVGAIDSIVDVVGTVFGLERLGIEKLHASSLPLSPGRLDHGSHPLPLPGPAAMALLAEARAPTHPFGDGVELVTPTGAAIVATLASFEQPPMVLDRIGYGAGGRELAWPNVLRLWVGTPVAASHDAPQHVVLETNLDDMSPQLLAPVVDQLLAAGALDVTVTPVTMKKGRAGVTLAVIAPAGDERALAELLLRETTTLGVRCHDVRRHEADRSFAEVLTDYGPITVKLKLLAGEVVAAVPEFESVRARAGEHHVPLITVHTAAVVAAAALATRRPVAAGA